MATLNTITLCSPSAAAVAEAIATAMGDAPALSWWPLILADGSESRGTTICLDGDVELMITETERPESGLPRALTLTVPDVEAAIERLSGAGFSVLTPEDYGITTRRIKARCEVVPGFALNLGEAAA